MDDILSVESFIEQSKSGILIDVRSPGEFACGHIPGAINIPLFSDEERAEVGTIYVQSSPELAVDRGLEIVGPKMSGFVKRARSLSEGKSLYIYCWRGGKRSNSMAWLMRTAGMKAKTMKGGYKAWRNSFYELLEKDEWKLKVVGGMTGSGKTELLSKLRERGEQVIDLEYLASHKGSAFGHIDEGTQPTTEHFINLIHTVFRSFDSKKTVWFEDESKNIGHVFIPDQLYNLIKKAPLINYTIPVNYRIDRLMEIYGKTSPSTLIDAFSKISKRLGREKTLEAIQFISEGDIRGAALIALGYYDRLYKYSLENSNHSDKTDFIMDTDHPEMAAEKLISTYNY